MMANIYDFEQARQDKLNSEPYVAPPLIESVPEDIRDALDSRAVADRRRLLRAAVSLVTSTDIPVSRELTADEQLPIFEYPPTEDK